MAVNRTNAVVGAIGAAALIVFGWWLFTAIKETEERGQAAKRQEEQARLVKVEADRAAALAAQKKREEIITRLSAGKVAQWTREDATLRLIALQGATLLRENEDLCPGFKKVSSRNPRDEFDLREKEKAEARELERCVEEIKGRVPPVPDLMWMSCSLASERLSYDFAKQHFKAEFANCVLHSDGIWHRKGFADELVLQGANSAGVFQLGSLWLPVEESRARDLKQRLARARVEVAFEPWPFGPTPLKKSESFGGIRLDPTTLNAFGGKAVAFRIVSGSRDVIVDWTLYAADADGKEPVAKVVLESAATKTDSQQFRNKGN